jgi:hypothetical protein
VALSLSFTGSPIHPPLGALIPPALGGEGHSPALRRRRTSGTQGQPTAGASSHRVPGASAWVASAPPLTLPPSAWSGHGCPSTARATVAPCVGPPHPRLLPWRRSHRGVVQDIVRRRGDDRVLGWSCPHSAGGRERGPLRACCGSRRPLVQRWPLSSVLRWSPPLVRQPVAEVVASAGETVSATCRRASNSLSLMASLSPPIGRRGEKRFAMAHVLR